MHTPEPWKFVKHDYGMMNCGHIEGRDEAEPNNPQMHRTIAVVCNHAPMDICAENGKLLASAPKLKRDLEGCLDLCERLLASKTGHNWRFNSEEEDLWVSLKVLLRKHGR